MAKPHFEDIAMGSFNYQQALKNSKSDRDQALKSDTAMYQIKYS